MSSGPESVLGGFLLVGASLLAGYAGHVLFRRFHVSDVAVLLLVGVLLGPVAGAIDPAWIAPTFYKLAPLGLAIVLFEGGLELAWHELRTHAGRAFRLALVTWGITAVAVALVAQAALGLTPSNAVLFGVAVCATGMFVVIPLLGQLRAPADARVLLTVETSVGDLLSAVGTVAIAGALAFGVPASAGVPVVAAKALVGGSVGLLAGLVWARVLTPLNGERHAYPLTLAALLVAYVASERLGGSGFLTALAFGLVVGNAAPLTRLGGLPALSTLAPQARAQQSEIIFVLRSVYFVLLGALVSPAVFETRTLLGGAAIVGAMMLARWVGVRTALPGRLPPGGEETRLLLVAMMPRGLAAALIASLPAAMGVPGTERFLDYAFLVILGLDLATSAGVFAYARGRKGTSKTAVPAVAGDA